MAKVANGSGSDGAGADDALLTAYLDGELAGVDATALGARLSSEPTLKARLDRLAVASAPLAGAYAALNTAAPRTRLEGILAEARMKQRGRRQRGQWRAVLALAAAIVIFVLGGIAGRMLPQPVANVANNELNWRQAVAEYQHFTTGETLAAIPDAPQVLGAELGAISTRLAVELTPDKLALPGALLKRADLFSFNGRPLAQLAYLTADAGPIAFCIIPTQKADATVMFETRDGFNVVYWNDDGRAYMLIGGAARATLERFAAVLSAKV